MSALLSDDPPPPAAGARAGQIVGERYEITGELGRGSTGSVWDALDRTTGERVAVKILHDDLVQSPLVRKRFHRESSSARALEHPHSVRVVGDGVTPDGADFLVMERLEGRSLSAELETKGALSQLRAIRIVAQILDATAEAHKRGIVHRDLKPGNVMLLAREDGADFVKVCDYGLAKIVKAGIGVDDSAFSTIQGAPCGTPAYMSPEQARGEDLDARTDLYAISVMLFRMVVGWLPFEARTPIDVISAHLSTPPPSARAMRPDLAIAPALEALILRGMAKDRRERPSSAEVYRADLLQIERDLVRDERCAPPSRNDQTLPAIGPAPLPLKRAKRRPPARFGGAVAAMLALVGSIVAYGVWRTPRVEGTAAPRGAAPTAATPIPAAKVEPRSAPPAAPAPVAPALVAPAVPAPAVRAAHKKRQVRPAKSVEAKHPVVVAETAADLLRQAEEAMRNGRTEDARVLGLAAAERQPSSAAAWEFLGRCYMRLGRPDEAGSFYRRALELSPNGPNAAYLRAIVEAGQRSRSP